MQALELRLEDERSTHDTTRRTMQRQITQAEEAKAAAERQLEVVQAELRLARTKMDKLEADIKEKEVRCQRYTRARFPE
jgi:phage-related tail protein